VASLSAPERAALLAIVDDWSGSGEAVTKLIRKGLIRESGGRLLLTDRGLAAFHTLLRLAPNLPQTNSAHTPPGLPFATHTNLPIGDTAKFNAAAFDTGAFDTGNANALDEPVPASPPYSQPDAFEQVAREALLNPDPAVEREIFESAFKEPSPSVSSGSGGTHDATNRVVQEIATRQRKFVAFIGASRRLHDDPPGSPRLETEAVERFGQLLSLHLTRGTRPGGSPDAEGVRWTVKGFAHAVGTTERSVRTWRAGKNLPIDLVPIERALFGDNRAYQDFRNELRRLYRLAREATEILRQIRKQLDEQPDGAEKETSDQSLQRASRDELAAVASPAPRLTQDGRLDAGPNAVYDVPESAIDLPTLPIRQRALIQTILVDLPGNAPKHLRTALTHYDEELETRGVQPILGLLKDMAAIIEAAAGAPDADGDWLARGMRTAFERFQKNHTLFVKHFPLDPKREELYARTPIDEDKAVGSAMSKPFESVANATRDANKAGITTDDFLRIVNKMANFAKVISTMPPSLPVAASPAHSENDAGRAENVTPIPAVRPQDRIAPTDVPVSAKKRMVLSGFGFFERVYNLLGSTATLSGPPEGNQLLIALRKAISALEKFFTNLP
jgi:hypothetical protein